jgi:hypothetical protein
VIFTSSLHFLLEQCPTQVDSTVNAREALCAGIQARHGGAVPQPWRVVQLGHSFSGRATVRKVVWEVML